MKPNERIVEQWWRQNGQPNGCGSTQKTFNEFYPRGHGIQQQMVTECKSPL